MQDYTKNHSINHNDKRQQSSLIPSKQHKQSENECEIKYIEDIKRKLASHEKSN